MQLRKQAITKIVLIIIVLAVAIYSIHLDDEPYVLSSEISPSNRPNDERQPARSEISPSNNVSQIQFNIANLLDKLDKYEKKNEERFNLNVLEQTQIKEAVAVLASRLTSLEEIAISHVLDEGDDDTADKLNKDTEDGSSQESLEPSLSQWMDNAMEFEYWDEAAEEHASIELVDSLSQTLPGVNLVGMQCGDGFCRATLAQADGERPDVSSLIGMPPFSTEGFTMDTGDGRLLVYFTESGVTLDDLRNRARGESN